VRNRFSYLIHHFVVLLLQGGGHKSKDRMIYSYSFIAGVLTLTSAEGLILSRAMVEKRNKNPYKPIKTM
jgi:hypothetical protein